MATIKTRVLSALGQDNATFLDDINDLDIIFEEGIWEIAQAIPPRLLSQRCPQPHNPRKAVGGNRALTASGTLDISESIVLQIIRTKADASANYDAKPVKEVPYEESHKALDSNSLYFATDYSPVWWKENVSGKAILETAPITSGENVTSAALSANQSALEVFKYDKQHIIGGSAPATWDGNGTDYVVGDLVSTGGVEPYYECIFAHTSTADGDSETGAPNLSTSWRETKHYSTMTEFNNIPEELEDIIIKRIAMKILEQKLQNSAVQDEDNEIFTLLNSAMMKMAEETKGSLMLVQKMYGEKELTKE